jgi:Protein of unknown function (DUF2889)
MNLMSDFRRNIELSLVDTAGNATLVTCVMTDKFHDIVLEVTVDNESLVIKEIGLDFRKAPMENCMESGVRLDLLTGVSIGKGLTRRLFEALGGSSGCPNLRNMLLCALPLVLNVRGAEGFSGVTEMMEGLHEQLRGTCAGYG